MFIQVLRGKVKDADAAKASGERWQEEIEFVDLRDPQLHSA